MIDLPAGWPRYCRDLKQLADTMNRKLPKQESGDHHALADARWTRLAWMSIQDAAGPAAPTETKELRRDFS